MYRKGDIKRVNATKADVSTVASVSLCVKRRTCFEKVLRCASCTPCMSRNALRTCHCVTDFLFSHRIYCNTVSQLMRLAWGWSVLLSSVKCRSYVCLYCFFYLSNFQEKCTCTTFPLGLSINPLWSYLDILLYFIRFFWIFWDIVFIFIYIVLYISICLSQIYFEIIFCQYDQYNFLVLYFTL